ncbi:MAG: hypothetical protein ACR2HG_11490 [Pyrinomonadaceae bacterium]
MPNRIKLIYYFIVVILIVSTACRTARKTDLRKLAPGDAIAFLETDDLKETLEAIADSAAFRELAPDAPDFSAFKNIQIAIVINGFESDEKRITDENSVLNFKPQFVAVIETHAWNWQTRSLVENQMDKFVRKIYGGDARLETSDKDGGKFYTWTASGNRKAFAFVEGSLIYFGNDAAALEKCLAVKRGEANNLSNRESFAGAENNLAFGYVSPDGVKQISNLAGVFVAADAAEESEERNFIARVLPQIAQNSAREILWTANKTTRGIEDDYKISLTSEAASEVKDILATNPDAQIAAAEFLPPDFYLATRYNLKNPLTAWRGMLSLAAKNTDVLSGKILIRFSDSLLESYGAASAEKFLDAAASPIITAQFDADGTQSVSIVSAADADKLKDSITKEINFKVPSEKQFDADVWFSEDKRLAAAFAGNHLILGDGESVLKCLEAKQSGRNYTKNPTFQKFLQNHSTSFTFGKDADSAEKIVRVLAAKKDENRKLATFYTTETRFAENKIERVTVSDFGLIGTILKQFTN